MSDWYDSSGVRAERTNIVIDGLLDWAAKTNRTRITRKNIEDAVRDLTPADSDGTIDEYVERVTRYGPFEKHTPGKWEIVDPEVEA